jgi:hypothetical protein
LGSSTASLTGNAFGSGATLAAQTTDVEATQGITFYSENLAAIYFPRLDVSTKSQNFSVSPFTEILISGTVDQSVTKSGGSFYSFANYAFSLRQDSSSTPLSSAAGSLDSLYGRPGTYTNHEAFSISFMNASANFAQGEFDGNATAIAAGMVPEPSSTALLFAGLGLVAFARRRIAISR